MLDELKNRRSIRKYSDELVSEEELNNIIEAGRYAPSGRGMQSSLIVAIQDQDIINRIKKLNREVLGKDVDPFYGASTLIVIFGNKNVDTYIIDASLVAGNIMNEAYSVGVGSCFIYRAKEEFELEDGIELKKELGIPSSYEGVANIVLGYPLEEVLPKPRRDNVIIIK